MRSNAAPRPNGLSAAFYKSSWNLIKDDVFNLVDNFYTTATFPRDINQTFIALIPKNQSLTPMDHRTIGLCNVIYKIISKSVANRVKDHLTDFICHSQATFILGKHITSNIIITQEIIHSFNLKAWKDHAFLLKIDLAKAFDTIEWAFISSALHRIGFMDHFINLIQICIYTSSLSILVNDEPIAYFHPQRGLRQGCPLSPYLFVLAINELSFKLQEALYNNNLSGISLRSGAPPSFTLFCLQMT